MIKEGAVEEVKKLKLLKYDLTLPIMKAHGVPEIIEYLQGKSSIDIAINKSQQNIRNYVKRQFTWWNGSNLNPDYVYNDFPSNIDFKALNILKKFTN